MMKNAMLLAMLVLSLLNYFLLLIHTHTHTIERERKENERKVKGLEDGMCIYIFKIRKWK